MDDYRFRVSDAYFVPLRGWMLRLKLQSGEFDPAALKAGGKLRLVAPNGTERDVTVKGLSTTGGFQKRDRVKAYGEFDIVISTDDALRDEHQVRIGWEAVPAR